MKNNIFKWMPLAVLIMATTSCDRGADSDDSTITEAGEAPTNRIDIPTSVRNNLGITFARVERRDVADILRVPGAFELKPLAKHEYRLMLPAQVRFEVNHLQTVETGTLLYRFQSPQWLDLQSRINLAVAGYEQATLKYEALAARISALASADFKRADLDATATDLQSEMIRQKSELNAALSSAANILNTYDTFENNLSADDLLVPVEKDGTSVPRYQSISWIDARAIKPGVVESLAVTDGTFVDETTLVLTTVDPTQIRFRALGLQSDLEKFENATSAKIVRHQSSGNDINEGLPVELTLGLDANPIERTITLFADPLEPRPWARPGGSAFLEVSTATSGGQVLAIPRSAVVKDGITHVFFKRDPMNPNKAIRIEADLGLNDGRWIEVKSEVGPTDEVVLEGAYELKLASEQGGTSQKGGHFHADGTYHGEH